MVGWREFVVPAFPRGRKGEKSYFCHWNGLFHLELSSTNIFWLEWWTPYQCEEMSHFLIAGTFPKKRFSFLKIQHPVRSSTGFCTSMGMASQESYCSWTAHGTVCYTESDKTGLKLISFTRNAWGILMGLHKAHANMLLLGYVSLRNYESKPIEKYTYCLFLVYQMLF